MYLPAILNCSNDDFGFEELSCADKVDTDFSYWSSIIETVLFHVDSSSESAASSIVQKNLNLIHKRFSPFPNSTVVNYLKAAQASDQHDTTFIIRILELLVQRMPWISAPDDVSWKNLQSLFKKMWIKF